MKIFAERLRELRTNKNISGYYLKCEQSNYTDHSVQLVMNIKNDKDYQVKLEPSVFTLRSSENEYSVTGLSVYQQNNWNPTAVRVSVNAGETTTFKLEFSGAGQDSNYYLYYLNTKIATVSQNVFVFV